MRYPRRLAAIVLVPLFMAGCASLPETNYCVIGGAVAGAAAGVAVGGQVGGGLVGAGVGAVMGEAHCPTMAKKAPMMKDSDGDGIPDNLDKCPNTPPDVSIDNNGCPYDDDGDGVPDFLDLCPNTPKGALVNFNGCPYDSDGDGVYDGLDKCPGTPKGVQVDSKGCPVAQQPMAIVTNINFDFDSSKIREDSKAKLAQVIAIMKDNPDLNVKVVGYTDSTGPANYNQALSVRRAKAVVDYISMHGVAANRMMAEGKGESDPLVPNTTRAGRAVNRRVEFEVVK